MTLLLVKSDPKIGVVFVGKQFSLSMITILLLSVTIIPRMSVYSSAQTEDIYWPIESWRVSTLQEQDMNEQRIDRLVERIEDGSAVRSLLIIRNGYIVFERYRQGYDSNSLMHIFSCTKSFISALIGIALRKGYIDSIDDPILPYFPNWTIENVDARKERMTIRDLLTMTPGVDWNEHNISYSSPDNMVNKMLTSDNPAKFVLDLKMVSEPGLDYRYNTGASQVLSALLREVTGIRPMEYAKEFLFEPLGISDIAWALTRVDTNLGGSQLYIRSRDMARFGYLYLQHGVWNSTTIIPSNYLEESKSPLISTYYGHEYGLHWWVDETHGYFCALGSQGQGIFIDPTLNLMMVITGGSDSIPMEVYFESYVQRAATEGYTTDGSEEPPPLEPDYRVVVIFGFMITGAVAIMLVLIYPKQRKSTQ
ncbi:MAG: serine hydrolase domain-containing protein [Candidatus Thorarchaeota archaeon]